MVEQRKSRRFELRLPVELIRAGARFIEHGGETKNLSSSGVLISTDALVSIGESIEYFITLPITALGEQAVRLRCMGKVVRQEVATSAATLERYEFVRGWRPVTPPLQTSTGQRQ